MSCVNGRCNPRIGAEALTRRSSPRGRPPRRVDRRFTLTDRVSLPEILSRCTKDCQHIPRFELFRELFCGLFIGPFHEQFSEPLGEPFVEYRPLPFSPDLAHVERDHNHDSNEASRATRPR